MKYRVSIGDTDRRKILTVAGFERGSPSLQVKLKLIRLR